MAKAKMSCTISAKLMWAGEAAVQKVAYVPLSASTVTTKSDETAGSKAQLLKRIDEQLRSIP